MTREVVRNRVDFTQKTLEDRVMKQNSLQFSPVFYTGSPAVG